jgi:hypothetical protein
MICGACEAARQGKPTDGLAHTCAGSGTYLAAEGYDAGMVEEITAAWPLFEVNLKFVMQAADEQMVREKMTPLVEGLLRDDLTQWGDFTVAAREGVTA